MHEYDGELLCTNVAAPDFEHRAITRETVRGHIMFESRDFLYRVYRQRRHNGEIFGTPIARCYNFGLAMRAAMGDERNIY